MTSSADGVPGRSGMVDQAYRQIRDSIVAVRLQPERPARREGAQFLARAGAHPDP